MTTLIATAAVLFQWLLMAVVVLGIGSLFSRLIRGHLDQPIKLPATAWIGLAVTCGWLYLIHLLVPLHSPVSWLPLLTGSLAGIALTGGAARTAVLHTVRLFRQSPWILLVVGVLLAVVVGMANQSLAMPTWPDSYLYHFNAVDFYAQFPAIKGLANLHDRYGFQSSTLLLSAAADVGIWKGEGFRLVNGFLFTLLFSDVAYRLVASIVRRTVSLGTLVLLVAVTLFVSLNPVRVPDWVLASPNLDIGAAILFIVAMAYFADAVAQPSKANVLVALMVAAVSATFRPANLLAFVIVVTVLFFFTTPRGMRLNWFLLPVLASAAVVVTGMIHTTFLSGYPLFPSTFPDLGLDWRLPEGQAAEVVHAITSWARFGATGITEYGPISWFKSWLTWLWTYGHVRDFAPSIFAFSVGVLLLVVAKRRRAHAKLMLILLAPLIPTLMVWFYTAPDLRFAYGPLVVLGAIPFAIALTPRLRPAGDRSIASTQPGAKFDLWAVIAAGFLLVICWGPAIDGLPDPVRASGDGVFHSNEPIVRDLAPFDPPGDWIRWSATLNQECGRELRCVPLPDSNKAVILRGDDIEDGFRRASADSPD